MVMGSVWKVFSILFEDNEPEYVSALSAVEQASQRAMKRMSDEFKAFMEQVTANLDRIKDDYGTVCADREDALESGRVKSENIAALHARAEELEAHSKGLEVEERKRRVEYDVMEASLKRAETGQVALKQEHEETDEFFSGRIRALISENEKLKLDMAEKEGSQAEMEKFRFLLKEANTAKGETDRELKALRVKTDVLEKSQANAMNHDALFKKQADEHQEAIAKLETELKTATGARDANKRLADVIRKQLTAAKEEKRKLAKEANRVLEAGFKEGANRELAPMPPPGLEAGLSQTLGGGKDLGEGEEPEKVWVTFDDTGDMHESEQPPTDEEITVLRGDALARASFVKSRGTSTYLLHSIRATCLLHHVFCFS